MGFPSAPCLSAIEKTSFYVKMTQFGSRLYANLKLAGLCYFHFTGLQEFIHTSLETLTPPPLAILRPLVTAFFHTVQWSHCPGVVGTHSHHRQ